MLVAFVALGAEWSFLWPGGGGRVSFGSGKKEVAARGPEVPTEGCKKWTLLLQNLFSFGAHGSWPCLF